MFFLFLTNQKKMIYARSNKNECSEMTDPKDAYQIVLKLSCDFSRILNVILDLDVVNASISS